MTVIINVASSNGLDLSWATLYDLFANSPVQDGGTDSAFTLLNNGAFNGEDADVKFIIEGSGFTYAGTFPNIQVTGGTIGSITMQTEAGVTLASFTGFSISAAAFDAAVDTYIGGGPGSPDPSALDAIFRTEQYEVTGGASNDIVEGGDLEDVLDGGAGADVFIGGAGNDTLVGGGAEGDTADYSTDALHGGTQGVIVNQHGGLSQGGLPPDTAIDGFGDTDSIANVRNVVGTQFDDQIYGGTHDNRIDGGAGSDILFGHDGNDRLIGGAGGDTLDGGNGNLDRASYITSTSGVTADLASPGNNTGDAAGDTYANIEGLEGSDFDDDLRGNNANNFLIGGAGADILDGRGGSDSASYGTATAGVTASLASPASNTGDAAGDTYISIENLAGSAFDDTLIGNAGNNFLLGRDGADVLDGGAGFDTADYLLSTAGLTVDLGTPGNNTGEAVDDVYISIENLRGSAFDDILRGNASNNLLDGQAGADTLDGGAGFDFAWYNTNSTGTGVTASLSDPGINTGDAAGDVYISIEGLVGSSVADTLIGDGGNNFLRGQGGADTLDGRGEFDFADYFNATFGVTVDLANPENNTGEAAGDTYISIEGIRGSAFDDILRGNNVLNGGTSVNELIGGLGADTLDGNGGFDYADYRNSTVGLLVSLANPGSNTGEAVGDVFIDIEGLIGSDFVDTLIGDAASNTLVGGLGGDTLDGQGGFDYAAYFRSTSGVTVSLAAPGVNTGEAVGDTFIDIEGLIGSDFADVLIGDSGDNVLVGSTAGDVLDGGDGSDTARYLIWTAQTGVRASLADPSSNTGEAAGDTYISLENLWGTAFNDTLIGDENDNILTGDAGNDVLIGNAGADTLDGGSGQDRASYITSASGLTADLLTPANNTGDAAGDSYISIEGLEGSNFDDVLRGDNSNNFLIGGAGADALDGRGGFDFASYITAAAGVTASLASPASNTGDAVGDSYISIEGLIGSNFDDTLIGNSGNNFLRGQGGADALIGGSGFDFADYFNATTGVTVDLSNPANNTGEAAGDVFSSIEGIRGSAFDDILRGDAGLNGGTAVNMLIGGQGADILDGNGGYDYADYRNSTVGVLVSLADPGSNTGEAAGDVFIDIEAIIGSDFADTLIGDGNSNNLVGGLGGDTLDGQGGFDYAAYFRSTSGVTVSLADTGANTGEAVGDTFLSIEGLIGSDFADVLIGDSGDNVLVGGIGGDVLDGGDGSDTARYLIWTAQVGVIASLADPGANTGEAAGDTYTSIENLWGTSFNDRLIGDENDNVLTGDAGNDVLVGGGGADTLDGGNGSQDRASYITAASGLTADLLAPENNTGDAVGDSYIGIEGLEGSAFDDDLRGNNSNNFLIGGAGADALDGRGGHDFASYGTATAGVTASLASPASNTGDAEGDSYISIESLAGSAFDDTLIGDAGGNFLQGRGGADALDGGGEFDWADYVNATTGVTVDLADPSNNTGEAFGDTYVAIEAIRGSAFDDILRGDDVLNGGTALNIFRGGLGADTLDGGGGNDYADYAESSIGLTVSLSDPSMNTGEAAGDVFISIEGIFGSNFDDVLIGDANTNRLAGGLGADALDGGDGIDFAHYNRASSGLTVSLADPGINTGEAFGDTYISIEGIIGSRFDDILIGDAGDNVFVGAEGADALDGGDGIDTADYTSWRAVVGVTASLADSSINTGDAAGDTYISIENLRGTNFDDVLAGDAGDNRLDGNLGTDIAVFIGNRSDYLVTQNLDGSITIADTRGGSPDGTDTTVNVELFQFADATYTAAELFEENQAPTDIALDNASIEENATAGTLVGTLSATDPDAGDGLTFTLIDDAGGRFGIVNGNEIVVANGADLDFEAAASHSVTVRVTDSAGLFYDETFVIAISDVNEAPTSLTLTGGSVDENAAAGTVVGTLAATDPDTGDTLTFALTDDAGGLFELVGDEVRVAAGAELDFEAGSTHTIAVEVTDSGGLTRLETFTIAVNDVNEAPDSLVVTGSEVEENAAAGTVVATLDATDPDTGDTLTFSLADDAGGRFEIVGNEIRVAPGADLDFEAAPTHDITVEVTDSGGLTRTQAVSIAVINVEEEPSDIILTGGEVAEDAASGAVVATLDAVDPDGPGSVTFTLADDAGGLFEIVGNEIRLAAGAVLDYETQASYEVTVEAVDGSGLTRTETFTIAVLNVNEAPTDITVSGGMVEENAAAGTLVATLAAVDPEVGDTFTFEIVNDASGFFEVVGNEIRVAAGAQIDYETQTEHVVTVCVTDASGAFYEEDMTISVENVAPIIIGTNANNTLVGTSEEDQIFGLAGNDTLSGGEGDDQLFGEAGNDTLEGGAGLDTLIGGLNNDTYILNADDGDILVENAGEGADTVRIGAGYAGASYTLLENFENLVLLGAADIDGFGNDLNNSITGNLGNNAIDGGLGADTMTGGGGNDIYYVDVASDSVVETLGGGIDEIRTAVSTYSLAGLGNVENLTYIGIGDFTGTGNAAANVLTGGTGSDTLDGAGGADTLIGGSGDDTYIVNHAGDVVVELAGEGASDTVRASLSYTLGAELENLILTGTGGFTGTGNSLDNVITGNTGANTLDGAGGADTLIGGAGNDIYIVGDAGDSVVELAGQGTDTVRSLLSDFGLELLTNVEHLTFVGTGDFEGRGNDLANTITGGAGNDTLEGGAGDDTLVGNDGNDSLDGGLGVDTMRGGIGDDSYFVDNALDRAIENNGQGIDSVTASVNFTLGANVENLILTGSATDGTGNGLANVVTGTGLANTLSGQAGNDVLIGGGGLDTLLGGSGDDMLVFNGPVFGQADGGTNQDTFVFGGDFDLDLTLIGNSALAGLEAFDVSGGAGVDNLLRIGIDDVRDLSSSANAALAGSGFGGPLSGNSIVVYGDAGDTVELAPGTGSFAGGTWQNAGIASIGGDTFGVYNYVIGSTLYGSIAVDTDLLVV